tara:strand:- start:83 stop:439 length:357 start_codon:yes stop_codon:yes gene_type:complete
LLKFRRQVNQLQLQFDHLIVSIFNAFHYPNLNQRNKRDKTRRRQLRISLLHPILTAATPVMLANIVSKLELLYRHFALWAISHQQTPFFEGDQPPCVSKMSSIMSPVRELPFLGTDSK